MIFLYFLPFWVLGFVLTVSIQKVIDTQRKRFWIFMTISFFAFLWEHFNVIQYFSDSTGFADFYVLETIPLLAAGIYWFLVWVSNNGFESIPAKIGIFIVCIFLSQFLNIGIINLYNGILDYQQQRYYESKFIDIKNNINIQTSIDCVISGYARVGDNREKFAFYASNQDNILLDSGYILDGIQYERIKKYGEFIDYVSYAIDKKAKCIVLPESPYDWKSSYIIKSVVLDNGSEQDFMNYITDMLDEEVRKMSVQDN